MTVQLRVESTESRADELAAAVRRGDASRVSSIFGYAASDIKSQFQDPLDPQELTKLSKVVKKLVDEEIHSLANAKSDDYLILHRAILNKNLNIFNILIDAGADPNAFNSYGQNAAHVLASLNLSTTKDRALADEFLKGLQRAHANFGMDLHNNWPSYIAARPTLKILDINKPIPDPEINGNVNLWLAHRLKSLEKENSSTFEKYRDKIRGSLQINHTDPIIAKKRKNIG